MGSGWPSTPLPGSQRLLLGGTPTWRIVEVVGVYDLVGRGNDKYLWIPFSQLLSDSPLHCPHDPQWQAPFWAD